MTPERCMDYARDYIQTRYGTHECLIVLHREHCGSDGTDRFSAHVAVNRSDLATGLRLNEGPRARRRNHAPRPCAPSTRSMASSSSNVARRTPACTAGSPERRSATWPARDRLSAPRTERVRRAVAKRIEEVGVYPPAQTAWPSSAPPRAGRHQAQALQERQPSNRFHSKSLGGERKMNGAKLGYVTHRRTGRTIRFTYHGVMRAIKLCMRSYTAPWIT